MEFANDDLRRFYAHAATLEPTDAEVARLIAAIKTRKAPVASGRSAFRRRRGLAALALATLAAAVASAVAYPAVRDALDSFFNGGSAPGAQVRAGSLPEFLTGEGDGAHPASGSERLVAEQDGEQMFAFRDAKKGRACIVIGTDSDTCSDASAWHRLFEGHALLKLASGVGPTVEGQVAVFGLARSAVYQVELKDGDVVVASSPVTNGGWVIVAPQGAHDRLVGLDRGGNTLETLDASGWTWSFCQRESGCGP